MRASFFHGGHKKHVNVVLSRDFSESEEHHERIQRMPDHISVGRLVFISELSARTQNSEIIFDRFWNRLCDRGNITLGWVVAMSIQAQSNSRAMPYWNLLLCIGSWWGAFKLYKIGVAGVDAAAIGAMGLIGFGLYFTVKTLNSWDHVRDRKRLHRTLEGFADNQGKSKLGDLKAAEEAGLLTGKGIILGTLDGKRITYPGEASVVVAGPPGSMKGVGFAIPQLLDYQPVDPDWGTSFVTLDLTGELYAVTARRQKELGRDVVVLGPNAAELSKELHIDMETTPSNPFAFLNPKSRTVKDDVEMAVRMLRPEPPGERKGGGTAEHFGDLGRLVVSMHTLDELRLNGKVTLPALRHRIMTPNMDLAMSLNKMMESDAFSGALRENAAAVAALMANSGEELSGAITTGIRLVSLFDAHGPVGKQVSTHEFDWGQIKERPTCVYIIVPPELLATQAQWLNLTLSMSFEMIARHRSNRRVVYLLDEISHAGFLPNILRSVGLYRKSGIQIIWILQQLETQLSRVYGKEAAAEALGMADVIQTMSAREWSDLKKLSDLAGQETVADGSHTLREGSGGEPEYSYSGNFRGRPVLRPEFIRGLPSNKTLVMHKNSPPFVLDILNYLDPKNGLLKHADENPYYRKG